MHFMPATGCWLGSRHLARNGNRSVVRSLGVVEACNGLTVRKRPGNQEKNEREATLQCRKEAEVMTFLSSREAIACTTRREKEK